MKSTIALFAVVAFVAVGAFPTSPPHIPFPAPQSITSSSSRHSAETKSACSQDSVTSVQRTDASGHITRTSTNDHSAVAAATRSSEQANKQTIVYNNGEVATNSFSSKKAAASKAQSATKDHRTETTDCFGNTVSKRDQSSIASNQNTRSRQDESNFTHNTAGGEYSSGSSSHNSASSTNADSAENIHSKTIKDARGGSKSTYVKEKSATRDDNSSSDSHSKNTYIGACGDRVDTDSNWATADSSHATTASLEKGHTSHRPDGQLVIKKEKTESAETKDAHQDTYGHHGVSTDSRGNTVSWGMDRDHRTANEAKSTATEKQKIVVDAKGNVQVDKEREQRASKKSASSDDHKEYKNVANIDGSRETSYNVNKQAARSQAESAAIDKVSATYNKDGTTMYSSVTGKSASEKNASSQDSVTSVQRTDASGHITRTSTNDHSAVAAAARSSEKANKQTIVYNNGAVTTSSSSSKDAAASKLQSAFKDHRTDSTDCYGNTVSKRDQSSIASNQNTRSRQDESNFTHNTAGGEYSSGSSSHNSASSTNADSAEKIHSKTIKDARGGSKSTYVKEKSATRDDNSSSDSHSKNTYIGACGDRVDTDSNWATADSSHATTASLEKGHTSHRPDGQLVIKKEKTESAETKDAHQDTYGHHGVSTDSRGNTVSWGMDRDHRTANEAKSTATEKQKIVVDAKGNVQVDKEREQRASKKSASSDDHKEYKNVANIDGSRETSYNVNKQAARSQAESAAIDKVSATYNKDGTTMYSSVTGKSASEKNASSQDSVTSVQRTDASGHITRTSTNDHSAVAAAARSSEKANKQTIVYNNGAVTTSSSSSKDAAASKLQSAFKDHRTDSTDCYGNTVSKRDQSSIASNRNTRSRQDESNFTHNTAGGEYSSGSSSHNSASSTNADSAENIHSKTIKDARGGSKSTYVKEKSATRDDNSSSDSHSKNTYIGACGDRVDTDSNWATADSSHATTASLEKGHTSHRPDGQLVIKKEKTESAETKDAHQDTYGHHGVSTDSRGNTVSWGMDRDHRTANEAKSTATEKQKIVVDAKGNVQVDKEREQRASKKSASSDDHKEYKNVANIDGSRETSYNVNKQAARSQAESAAIDKVSATYNKDGTTMYSSVTGKSASEKNASSQDSVTSVQRTDASGHITRTSTNDHSAVAAAARSSEKANKQTIVYNNGAVTTSSSSSKDAAASKLQSAFKDHRTDSTDCYGNTVSKRDQSSIASNRNTRSRQDESNFTHNTAGGEYSSGSSSHNSASSTNADSAENIHSKTIKDARGGSKSTYVKEKSATRDDNSSSDSHSKNTYIGACGDRVDTDSNWATADSSHATTASLEKGHTSHRPDGQLVIKKEKTESAETKDAHQDTYGHHGVSTDSRGNTVSWGMDRDHRTANEAKSTATEKQKIVVDAKGNVQVDKEREQRASKKSASSDDHKEYKNVANIDGSRETSYNVNKQAARSQAESAAIDKVSATYNKDGTTMYSSVTGKSASEKNASSQDSVTSVQRTDASGHITRTSTNDHSAVAAAARSSEKANKQTIVYNNGAVTTSSSSSKDAAASKLQSAFKDHRTDSTDCYGNTVSKRDQSSIASNQNTRSRQDESNFTHNTAGGEYSSGSSSHNSASSTNADSAENIHSKTIKDARGGSKSTYVKEKSATRDDNSSSDSHSKNTYIGACGDRVDTDSNWATADSSHATTASLEKGHTSHRPDGQLVIKKEKTESAETKDAHQDTYGHHGVSTDSRGNTVSWGMDRDHRTANEAKSTATEKQKIVVDAKGNVQVDKEREQRASKKSASSDDHKEYKNVANNDGSRETSYNVNKQAASSQAESAAIDKVSTTYNKDGTIMYSSDTGNSASVEGGSSHGSANSVQSTDASGHITRTSTNDHSAVAAATRSSEQANKQTIVYNNGAVTTSSSSSKDATASKQQSAFKDHRTDTTDCYGNTVSKQDQASSASEKIAKSSEHKSNDTYKTPSGDYWRGSSSHNSASSTNADSAEKNYNKTVKDARGGYKSTYNQEKSASRDDNSSSGSHMKNTYIGACGDRVDTDSNQATADSSHAASTSSVTGYTSHGPGGQKVSMNDKTETAEAKDAHQYTHGDHRVSTDSSGNTVSYGLDGDHRASNEANSALSDKEKCVVDKKGNVQVDKERKQSAMKKSASSDDHKEYKNVANNDGSSETSYNVNKQAASSQAESASINKVSKTYNKDGTIMYSSDTGNSASENSGSSSHNQSNQSTTNADGSQCITSSNSSNAVSHDAASANKKSERITYNPNGGLVHQKEETKSASVNDASSTKDQTTSETVDADGNTMITSSSSSSANQSSASSSSYSSEQVTEC